MSQKRLSSVEEASNKRPKIVKGLRDPTKEQQDIITAFRSANPGAMVRVQACAGAGKTTTLAHVLKWATEQADKRVMVTSFANVTVNNITKEMEHLGIDLKFKEFGEFEPSDHGMFTSTLHSICKHFPYGSFEPQNTAEAEACREALMKFPGALS